MRWKERLQTASRIMLSLVIAFYVSAMVAWSLPQSNELLRAYSRFLHPIMTKSGIWQGWAMFAPNPRATNAQIDAEIRFANGDVRTWVLPRMDLEEVGKRPHLERWNQWGVSLGDPNSAVIRRDAARYVARLFRDPTNPPIRVQLRRQWSQVPAPLAGDHQPFDTRVTYENREVLYTYDVKGGELK